MSDALNCCEQTIYCHGLPGSADELYFLNSTVLKPTRVFGPQHEFEICDFFTANSDKRIHVIGFSIGAFAAIKIARNHGHLISMVTLISPAAPLQLGEFLTQMAGKLVFQTAARSAFQFRLLTAAQHLGVHFSSEFVISAIFKDSPDSDKALLKDPHFKQALRSGLKQSYGKNNSAYRREIEAYVSPWADQLADIICPVKIHHGLLDNWAPVEMAYALRDNISTDVELIVHRDLGHFSTLQNTLPKALDYFSVSAM